MEANQEQSVVAPFLNENKINYITPSIKSRNRKVFDKIREAHGLDKTPIKKCECVADNCWHDKVNPVVIINY